MVDGVGDLGGLRRGEARSEDEHEGLGWVRLGSERGQGLGLCKNFRLEGLLTELIQQSYPRHRISDIASASVA